MSGGSADDRCVYRRSQAGFTLLETLVALTLLAMALAIVFGQFRFGTAVWADSAERTEKVNTFRTAYTTLNRLFTRSLPVARTSGDALVYVFSGDESMVSIVVPSPARSVVQGLTRITLSVSDVDRGQQLDVRWSPYSAGQNEASETNDIEPVILIAAAESIVFDYFIVPNDTSEGMWRERWDNPDTLPNLVRLTVTDRAGQVWPQLVFAMAIDIDRGCLPKLQSPDTKCRLSTLGDS